MSEFLYVKTTMNVPGVGSAVHVAEMRQYDHRSCHLLRLVALDPNGAVAGLATPTQSRGNVDQPQAMVPHPRTYDEFPDISAEHLPAEDFTVLWEEASAKFGELG